MNRRSLMAGMAAMIPATAMGQDATPEPATVSPEDVLTRYIDAVFTGHNPNAVADFFDPDALDLLDVQRAHVILLDGIDDDVPFRVRTITTNETAAIAYGKLRNEEGEKADAFLMIEVNDAGMIDFWRMIGQPST